MIVEPSCSRFGPQARFQAPDYTASGRCGTDSGLQAAARTTRLPALSRVEAIALKSSSTSMIWNHAPDRGAGLDVIENRHRRIVEDICSSEGLRIPCQALEIFRYPALGTLRWPRLFGCLTAKFWSSTERQTPPCVSHCAREGGQSLRCGAVPDSREYVLGTTYPSHATHREHLGYPL